MDDTVSDMIVLDKVEDLSLVDVPGVCPGVDDPVRIAGIRGADVFRFLILPPPRICALCRTGSKEQFALYGIDTGTEFRIFFPGLCTLRSVLHSARQSVPEDINGDDTAGAGRLWAVYFCVVPKVFLLFWLFSHFRIFSHIKNFATVRF